MNYITPLFFTLIFYSCNTCETAAPTTKAPTADTAAGTNIHITSHSLLIRFYSCNICEIVAPATNEPTTTAVTGTKNNILHSSFL